jgi:Ras GTPase-activating-like protein IQGAP2/3
MILHAVSSLYSVSTHLSLTDNRTAQKVLRDLKSKISSQSKKNFVLEKDVRYLDSRIALLVQNRMALEEVSPEACLTSSSPTDT